MARPDRYAIWLLMMLIFVMSPTTLLAQEETETPFPLTATFTATASPTETSTVTATATATNTATSTTTEAATNTATSTATNTATATELATGSDAPTETLAPSPELTAELTESAIEPGIEVTAELTESATEPGIETTEEVIDTATNSPNTAMLQNSYSVSQAVLLTNDSILELSEAIIPENYVELNLNLANIVQEQSAVTVNFFEDWEDTVWQPGFELFTASNAAPGFFGLAPVGFTSALETQGIVARSSAFDAGANISNLAIGAVVVFDQPYDVISADLQVGYRVTGPISQGLIDHVVEAIFYDEAGIEIGTSQEGCRYQYQLPTLSGSANTFSDSNAPCNLIMTRVNNVSTIWFLHRKDNLLPANIYDLSIDNLSMILEEVPPPTPTATPTATATPTEAPDSSPPGILINVPAIVFSNSFGGDSEIYKANGLSSTQLTDNLAEDTNPAYAPDGQGLAFQSDRSGVWEIYRMDIDGINEIALTIAGGIEPDWYPDSSALVFANGSNLYRVNDAGTGLAQLTNHPSGEAHNPAISSNGNWIVYVHDGNLNVIDGTCTTACISSPLLSGSSHAYPAWSPDGTQLVWSSSDDLYIASVDTTGATPQLTGITALTDANSPQKDTHPTWATDGQSILFESNRNGETSLFEFDLAVSAPASASSNIVVQQQAGPTATPTAAPGANVVADDVQGPDAIVAQANITENCGVFLTNLHEDRNNSGFIEHFEDENANHIYDIAEDPNGDGIFTIDEDVNGDGRFTPSEDKIGIYNRFGIIDPLHIILRNAPGGVEVARVYSRLEPPTGGVTTYYYENVVLGYPESGILWTENRNFTPKEQFFNGVINWIKIDYNGALAWVAQFSLNLDNCNLSSIPILSSFPGTISLGPELALGELPGTTSSFNGVLDPTEIFPPVGHCEAGIGTEESRERCSYDLYVRLYNHFELGNVPNRPHFALSDIIAIVLLYEMDNILTNIENGNTANLPLRESYALEAVTRQLAQVCAEARNTTPVSGLLNCDINGVIQYLSGIQGWYEQVNQTDPDRILRNDILGSWDSYFDVSEEIIWGSNSLWFGGYFATRPSKWGNYVDDPANTTDSYSTIATDASGSNPFVLPLGATPPNNLLFYAQYLRQNRV